LYKPEYKATHLLQWEDQKEKIFLTKLLLLLILTANGFSPGGSGTTIRQQTKNTKNTLLQ
jgi:hypothetical protein